MADNQTNTPTHEATKLDPQEVDANSSVDLEPVVDNERSATRDASEAESRSVKDPDQEPDERQHSRKPDDKRAEIFKSFKRENTEEYDNPNDLRNQYGTQVNTGEEADDDADDDEATGEAAEGKEQPDSSTQEQTFRLVTEGVEEHVTADELIRRAQKNGAADKNLQDAKAILARLEGLEANLATKKPDGTETAQSPTSPAKDSDGQTVNADDDAGLAEIVEAVQVGDIEEATQALKRFEERLRSNAGQPSDRKAEIIQAVREDTDQQTVQKAVQEFATSTPDFKPDDPLQSRLFQSSLIHELSRDLETVAKQNGEDVDAVREALTNARPEQIRAAHKQLRVNGIAPRAHLDVLRSAYSNISGGRPGGNPPGQGGVKVSETRQQRSATAQPQPAAKSRVATPATSDKQTPSDIIARMRKARGQTTTA